MPTYQYICEPEDRHFEIWQDFKDDALKECPECKGRVFKDYSRVAFDASTRPTSNAGRAALEVTNREKRWDKDMPAYRRMRIAGMQPKSIDGAAKIEQQATTQFEVESGRIIPNAENKINEAVNIIGEATGTNPLVPITTPTPVKAAS